MTQKLHALHEHLAQCSPANRTLHQPRHARCHAFPSASFGQSLSTIFLAFCWEGGGDAKALEQRKPAPPHAAQLSAVCEQYEPVAASESQVSQVGAAVSRQQPNVAMEVFGCRSQRQATR